MASGKIFVLGGDGFCGWPTALGLSTEGYEVTIVDNLSRRKIDVELEVGSLTPIKPINKRINTFKKISSKQINFVYLDVAKEYDRLASLIIKERPDVIVHFAEQRSAPYSMKSQFHKRYTVDNNINATNNVLCAIVESGLDIHLVHLGSMGVYGYGTAGIQIPEGYLKIQIEENGIKKEEEILYPANPGSIYHVTKTQDALLFYYYNKNDKLRITDLHQGIIWGTNTQETMLHEDLINRFDYDGDYGTVLNRFFIQAAIGYPLTVYGTGGQTRAFIHITDSVKCIKIAIKNPPKRGHKVEIFNQATESHTLYDLAKKVSEMTGAKIRYYIDPRNEDLKNELTFKNDKFLNLGLDPITLNDGLIDEVINIAQKFKKRCDIQKIICTSLWSKDKEVDLIGKKSKDN
jgi:UDP-sulfoquinovose synthase